MTVRGCLFLYPKCRPSRDPAVDSPNPHLSHSVVKLAALAHNKYLHLVPRKTKLSNDSTLAPLRVATFRYLWIASIVSNFGGLIQSVGAGWMMTSISDSATMVALVQASVALPITALALLTGAVADSFDRRRVMLLSQLFMLTVSVALAITAWQGLLSPWGLLTFTFLIGCGGAFFGPAWQASVGDIVPRNEVPAAVLLNSVSFNVTRSVAPAIGGAIVVAFGAAAAFVVNAATYLGLIGVLWRWKPDFGQSSIPRESLHAAVTTGVRYVAMSPNIVTVIVRSLVFGLTTVVILALLPLIALAMPGGTALTFGILLGAFGAGAVGGAMISRRLRELLSNEHVIQLTFVGFAACAGVAAVSASVILTSFALAVGGAMWVIALSLFNTTVQMSTPRWVVGRALSLYQMATFAGMAVGSWFWGFTAEILTPAYSLAFAAVAMLAGATLGQWLPLPSRENLNLDPLNRWQEPDIQVRLESRSGPIAISVEYQIDKTDLRKFLTVMSERKRIRRRDGAMDWVLTQDLADPELWLERFEVPTWVDYVRFHSRTTVADDKVSRLLRALHKGSWPPNIRRMIEWKAAPRVPRPSATLPPPEVT